MLRHKNVTVTARLGTGFRENDWVRHLEVENQIREIWKLETENPIWRHALMNGLREHLCLCASWLTNWIQAHFHHNGCIWIAVKVTKIKGFDLSLQQGFSLVSLFLVWSLLVQCKVDLFLRWPWGPCVEVNQLHGEPMRPSSSSWLPLSCQDWSLQPSL